MSFIETIKMSPDVRRSGRTTMLALHYVHLILDNPGRVVQVEDHHTTADADRRLFRLVYDMLCLLKVPVEVNKHTCIFMSREGRNDRYIYPDADLCLRASRKAYDDQQRGNPIERNFII